MAFKRKRRSRRSNGHSGGSFKRFRRAIGRKRSFWRRLKRERSRRAYRKSGDTIEWTYRVDGGIFDTFHPSSGIITGGTYTFSLGNLPANALQWLQTFTWFKLKSIQVVFMPMFNQTVSQVITTAPAETIFGTGQLYTLVEPNTYFDPTTVTAPTTSAGFLSFPKTRIWPGNRIVRIKWRPKLVNIDYDQNGIGGVAAQPSKWYLTAPAPANGGNPEDLLFGKLYFAYDPPEDPASVTDYSRRSCQQYRLFVTVVYNLKGRKSVY